MASLVHLALAQFQPRKADYQGNLGRLGDVVAQVTAMTPRPMVLCLPETALTGYFLEGGVREVAVTAGTLAADLQRTYLAHAAGAGTLDVMLGFYEVWRNRLFNSAMYVTLGGDAPVVRHVHRKVFLPTYGLFDEERFVERGRDVRAFDTPWGRAAMLVCEDLWHSMTATIAALDGAQVIFVPTAPPARGAWPRQDGIPGPASTARWERLARDVADEHGVYVALAQLTGGEGGKQFPGQSMVAGPRGELRARGALWEESVLAVTLDMRDVTRARADMPLVADLETMLPHLQASLAQVQGRVPHAVEYDAADHDRAGGPPETQHASASPASHHPSPAPRTISVLHGGPGAGGPAPLDIDAALVEEWLTVFLRDEVRRRGFQQVVIGISGGVDSAVAAYLAARALGPGNVHGIRMPYRTSSTESFAHGQAVIDALGIHGLTLDISAAVDGYLALDPDADGARRGNVMARMRMIALFDQSARLRAIPIGTGNKTERLFGYFTWHADDSPPINPLGDLFKTQVWALARHLGVPAAIVDKPPTADLVVGQTDEGDFGISYAKADEILNWMLAGYGTAELVERGHEAAEVQLVAHRVASTHWKRRLPTVAMLTGTAIGESYLRPVDY